MRPIPGYEEYFAMEDGRILGKSGGYLSSSIRSNYVTVGLCKPPNHRKSFLVHRLVAACYLGLDLYDMTIQVNHLDGNKLNNHLNNLELCTQSENIIHRSQLKWSKDSNTHKQCRRCLTLKLRSEFYKFQQSSDGIHLYCRSCLSTYSKSRSQN